MNLSLLAGNEPVKRLLAAEHGSRGLSHAYILSGEAGSGKRTLAKLLAAVFLCEGEGETPCLTCPHCRKVMRDIHPDLIRVGDDGSGINVAQARALRSDAYIRPNEGRRKVYLVENAQAMNANAQNALLKLLEEGPAYAAFLLLTDHASALLPTIRSRCQVLPLSPVSSREAEHYLRVRFPDRTDGEIAHAVHHSDGLLGLGVALLEGNDGDRPARAGAVRLVELLAGGEELPLLEFAITLEKWDRDALEEFFGESISLLRHALVLSAGGNPGEGDEKKLQVARKAAGALTPKALLEGVALLNKLRAACAFHAGAGHLAGWLCAALAQSR